MKSCIQLVLIISCCGHIAFLLFKMVVRFSCIKEVEKIATMTFAVSSAVCSFSFSRAEILGEAYHSSNEERLI